MGNCISKEEGNTDLPNAPFKPNIGKTVFIKRPEKYMDGADGEIQIKETYLTKNFLRELSSEVGDLDENMYVDTIKSEQDGIRDEDFYNEDSITLLRKGATIGIISEAIMNLAVKKLNSNVEKLYTSAGQFKFRHNDFDCLEGSEHDLENRDIAQINSIFYLGQWRKSTNLQEGKGVAIYLDGSLYEGLWKEGERSGIGRMIYSNSSVYQGEWYRDMPNGYGIFISEEIGNLKGYWNEGKIHGIGFEIMDNGNTYRGDFIEGRKKGKGVFVFKEGDIYIGEFNDNKIEGNGIYLHNAKGTPQKELNFEAFRGKKYKGTFKNSMMNGKGLFIWPDGREYEGDYLDDKKHGVGEYRWPDNKKYVGGWINGFQNGEGEFINFNNGVSFKGIWKDGKIGKINK